MKQKMLAVAISTMLLAISHSSQATPMVLSGSIADGTVLGAGNHSGLFDGSGLLPSSFKINSASFIFNFTDDTDGTTTVTSQAGPFLGSYEYFENLGNNNYSYVRKSLIKKTIAIKGEQESAELFFGNTKVGDGATIYSNSSSAVSSVGSTNFDYKNNYGGYEYYSCGNSGCYSWWIPSGSDSYYTRNITETTTTTENWSGNFSISGLINDSAMLNSLLIDKQMHWNLSVGGDLYLTKAQLFLDIDEIQQVGPSAVSAPSTVLMTLFGLLGLAGYKRRSKA